MTESIEGLDYIPRAISDIDAQLLLWSIPDALYDTPATKSPSLSASGQLHYFPPLPEWLHVAQQLIPASWAHKTWGERGQFDAVIIQRYMPGEGIIPHVDLDMYVALQNLDAKSSPQVRRWHCHFIPPIRHGYAAESDVGWSDCRNTPRSKQPVAAAGPRKVPMAPWNCSRRRRACQYYDAPCLTHYLWGCISTSKRQSL